MKNLTSPEIKEVMDRVPSKPEISIIMPIEPKFGSKEVLSHSLKLAVNKVERELLEKYPDEKSMAIIPKLKALVKDLKIDKHKKSVVIFVSPIFEKVFYLNILLEERIVIDDKFEIRDLVYCEKQQQNFLVLLLSSKECKMFVGNSETLIKLISQIPPSVYAFINDLPEKVGNFTDISKHKEIIMEKWLRHIDNALDNVIHEYKMPLIIMGTERIMGHFKKLTKYATKVVAYVHGNYEEASVPELQKILHPYFEDWKNIRQQELVKMLEEAGNRKRLATGIRAVWKDVMQGQGKMLLVENSYIYTAEQGHSESINTTNIEPIPRLSPLNDAVDELIEKVIENGGEVEFVDKEVLKDCQHIALIKFY